MSTREFTRIKQEIEKLRRALTDGLIYAKEDIAAFYGRIEALEWVLKIAGK